MTTTAPALVVERLAAHVDAFALRGEDGLLFAGPTGAVLRRSNFNRQVGWAAAVEAVGAPGLHFHDLRHTGNTMAAATGVSLRDLMARMGHDSMQAALIYQHRTQGGDRRIADCMSQLFEAGDSVPMTPGETATVARGLHDEGSSNGNGASGRASDTV